MTLLRMANVSSDLRFGSIFSPSGVLTALERDIIDSILGMGHLSTHFRRALPGSPAEGLTRFEYRIDLTQVGRDRPSVTAFSLDFDPLVDYLDYDFDGTPDHVFIITEGGLGSVAPQSADKEGRRITFTFDPPIRPGRPYHDGGSSFFFGMTSQFPDHAEASARVSFNNGSEANVRTRIPTAPRRIDEEIWQAWGKVIGGVPFDGGGVVISPGGTPIPVGPWDPMVDVLPALGAYSLADGIKDGATRTKLKMAAIEAMGDVITKLSQGEMGDTEVGEVPPP